MGAEFQQIVGQSLLSCARHSILAESSARCSGTGCLESGGGRWARRRSAGIGFSAEVRVVFAQYGLGLRGVQPVANR